MEPEQPTKPKRTKRPKRPTVKGDLHWIFEPVLRSYNPAVRAEKTKFRKNELINAWLDQH